MWSDFGRLAELLSVVYLVFDSFVSVNLLFLMCCINQLDLDLVHVDGTCDSWSHAESASGCFLFSLHICRVLQLYSCQHI